MLIYHPKASPETIPAKEHCNGQESRESCNSSRQRPAWARESTFTAAVCIQDDRLCGLQLAEFLPSTRVAGQEPASTRSFPDASGCQLRATYFTQEEPPVLEPLTLGLDSQSRSSLVARAMWERLATSVDGAVLKQSWPSNHVSDYFPCRATTSGGHSAVASVSGAGFSQCARRSSSQAATAAVETSSNVADRPSLSLESFQGDTRDASLDSNRGPLHEYKRRIRAGLLRPSDQFQVRVIQLRT